MTWCCARTPTLQELLDLMTEIMQSEKKDKKKDKDKDKEKDKEKSKEVRETERPGPQSPGPPIDTPPETPKTNTPPDTPTSPAKVCVRRARLSGVCTRNPYQAVWAVGSGLSLGRRLRSNFRSKFTCLFLAAGGEGGQGGQGRKGEQGCGFEEEQRRQVQRQG